MKKKYSYLLHMLFLCVFVLQHFNAKSQTNPQATIDAACPCYGPVSGGQWNNHGDYVSCVARKTTQLVSAGTITSAQRQVIMQKAAQSSCGKPENYPNESENENSAGILSLVPNLDNSVQPINSTLTFSIQNAQFSLDPLDFSVDINGKASPFSIGALSANSISINLALVDGENNIVFSAVDQGRFRLQGQYTIWGGTQQLPIIVLNPDGSAASNVVVKMALSDDPNITEQKTTTTGSTLFENLPLRTVLISAITPDNKFATAALVPTGLPLTLKLVGFNTPSIISNNDFSQGTSGWDIGASLVTIIPHTEGNALRLLSGAAIAAVDNDLKLSTSGEGARSASRTFTTTPGTKSVRVRFRFVTTEVPGGYFGSKFNDYYAVSARSLSNSTQQSDQNSMNGLGLGAFNFATGETAWRELVLPVKSTGDIVQVDATVANVGDGAFDSWVIIDYVDEKKVAVTQLTLNDIDNTSLKYISLDNHTYFSGNTRVHGKITIEGPADDHLTSLKLEVLKGGAVVATGSLNPAVQAGLFANFGTSGKVELTTSQHLFNIPATLGITGDVQLRVVASTATESSTKEAGKYVVFSRYDKTNRYGGRDTDKGGDDWALPSSVSFIGSLSSAWVFGDFSNMNGGAFSPHAGHDKGNNVDGWFTDFNKRDATTAQTIIDFLNSSSGPSVSRVGVTFTPAFKTAIANVTLADGRKATTVIRDWAGHTSHFHFDIAAIANGTLRQADFWQQWNRQRQNATFAARTMIPVNKLDNKLQNKILVYPNPSSNKVAVSGVLSNKIDKAEFIVTNSQGQVVYKQFIMNGNLKFEVDVFNKADGIYFYKVVQKGIIITNGKFMVSK